jgi:hypothetical protein
MLGLLIKERYECVVTRAIDNVGSVMHCDNRDGDFILYTLPI